MLTQFSTYTTPSAYLFYELRKREVLWTVGLLKLVEYKWKWIVFSTGDAIVLGTSNLAIRL